MEEREGTKTNQKDEKLIHESQKLMKYNDIDAKRKRSGKLK